MINNGWILVTDDLPKKEKEEVLVYLSSDIYRTDFIYNGKWFDYGEMVVAWKPIEKFEKKKVKKGGKNKLCQQEIQK